MYDEAAPPEETNSPMISRERSACTNRELATPIIAACAAGAAHVTSLLAHARTRARGEREALESSAAGCAVNNTKKNS